jgi:hypothetical protein
MALTPVVSWMSLACVVMLATQNAFLAARLTAAEARLESLAPAREIDRGGDGPGWSTAGAFGRRLSAVVAGENTLAHTASSGTNELGISSNQAVKVEQARFDGYNVGIDGDTDLITLASGRVTVAGTLKASTRVIEHGAVYFSAGITGSSDYTVTGGGTVVFNGELVDRGSGFNPSTGKFTAPVAGDYEFTWHISNSPSSTNCRYDVFKGATNTYYSLYAAQAYESGTLNVIMTLASGDIIDIRASNSCSIRAASSLTRSFFTGKLLRENA